MSRAPDPTPPASPPREGADPLQPRALAHATRSGPRWALLYFLLAGFDLLAISTSLALNHRIAETYSTSVSANEEWAQRLGSYTAISLLANRVNAPGNDVFASGDVETESTRMREALAAFEQSLARARADVHENVPDALRPRILQRLNAVGHATTQMAGEISSIFAELRARESAKAAERMAALDHAWSDVATALGDLQREIRAIQTQQFRDQEAQAAAIRRVEYVVAALILLMIGAVTLYGQTMSKAMRVTNEERERSVAALQASESTLRAIVDGAADGILTFDANGTIVSTNPAVRGIFGRDPEALIGEPLSVLFPTLKGPISSALLKPSADVARRSPGSVHLELQATRPDGRPLVVGLALGEVPSLGGPLFIAIVHDTTNEHEAMAALERARHVAEEANTAKSTFLANMSHELRTPLNAIIGYSEMLEEEAIANAHPAYVADLKRIRHAGRHLLTLINDILDLSKVEAGRMSLEIEPFDVAQLVDEVLSTIRPLATRNNNSLQTSCANDVGMMTSDSRRLRQVLINLLGNACKFTEGGVVWLVVWREQATEGDSIVLQVRDTGVGMTHEQIGRIFQPFTQADASTTRKYGGTGLGLAISRKLAHLLGGDITVESTMGRGSTFTCRVPAIRLATAQPEVDAPTVMVKMRAQPAAPDSHSNTVLVIDDDEMVHQRLSRLLAKEGLTAVTASSGLEGLRLAREISPAAITLDLLMPEMDGWSVLAALKADHQLSRIPVIIISVLENNGMGYTLGAADYVLKPVDAEELSNSLGRLLGAHPAGRVLIVEDDEDSRNLLARRLQSMGWSTDAVENGRVALARVAAEPPSLILLDLMMPELDGFAFLHELRENPSWRDIPVVVVTAKELTDEERERLQGNVAELVSKSAKSLDSVVGEVAECIRRRAA